MMRSAFISPCGLYRYELLRKWADGPTCVFLMLNPSIADGTIDDHTIRRCIFYAGREGCGELAVVNLFAYRATKPRDLVDALHAGIDPVGELNDAHILHWAANADLRVAAWGANGDLLGRGDQVRDLLAGHSLWSDTKCLGTTSAGHPRHPGRLGNDVALVDLP